MATEDKPLDYASPNTPRARREPILRVGPGHLWLAGMAFVIGLLPPHETGIYYLGGRPRWLVAVEQGRLAIGPNDAPMHLGRFWFVVVKLAVVLVPIWAAWRIWRRFKRGPESS